MTRLNFEAFFGSLHGQEPFPWQSRLWETVSQSGWPDVIAVPTSAGKTACMDIALFHLVMQADSRQRTAPLRIFHVIDRRVVVDEAYERAKMIEHKLVEAMKGSPGILKEAAERLAEYSGGDPLKTAVLRGGIYREDAWAGSPDQPLIAATTVDQIGSRLLFRGYGLSPNQAPIHAALVGNDALILVDEAHLSRPFLDSLTYLKKYREWGDAPIRSPWAFVRLSATPAEEGSIFREDDKDYANEKLKRRFNAAKPARLVQVICETVKKDDAKAHRLKVERANRQVLVESITEQAGALAKDDAVNIVGIVVNRVTTARRVYESLLEKGLGEVFLLTGRARPFDRDTLLQKLLPRIGVERDRNGTDREKLYIVATQCIEVGANLDFDALATECASLDALRQRFGRLDRLGKLGRSPAVIVVGSDQTSKNAPDDPVYGQAIKETWTWLISQAQKPKRKQKGVDGSKTSYEPVIDFGIQAMSGCLPQELDKLLPMLPPRKYAPVMLPAHLDIWVQTHPRPAADPEPSFWLHGPDTSPADCHVVWRADFDPNVTGTWRDLATLNPPSSAEALPLPVYAVRSWLAHRVDMDFGDQEGQSQGVWTPNRDESVRPVLVWRGPEESRVVPADDIRPGDTLVVPSSYGGLDGFGWNPESTLPATDIGDPVAWQQRGRPILRLHPKVIQSWSGEFIGDNTLHETLFKTLDQNEADMKTIVGRLSDWATIHPEQPEWAKGLIETLAQDSGRKVPYPDESGNFILVGRRRTRRGLTQPMEDDLTSQDDTSSFTAPIPLANHAVAVHDRCRLLADRCGLSALMAEDVALAGKFHDIGKVYRPFQLMLFGGDEVAEAMANEPLAKSGFSFRNAAAYNRARKRAGLPKGWRHELLSTALVGGTNAAMELAADTELVLHLIASHHGRCRPFAPFAKDDHPAEVGISLMGLDLTAWSEHGLERLDSGASERFWNLVRRYGWYGLVFLETIVRLADQRVSSEEEFRAAEKGIK